MRGNSPAWQVSLYKNYNPKFDVVSRVVDITGNETHYYYDAKGRLTKVVGPNEIKSGLLNPYTIKFEYFLQNPCNAPNFVPCALTKHFDIFGAGDDIETYNFVDGLGRVLQVKKDIEVNTAVNHTVPPGWTSYDEFGRKTDQYLPNWEPTKDCKMNAGLNIDFIEDKSTSTYDQLDRVLVLTDPELHTTTNTYSFENRQFKTKTVIQKNLTEQMVKSTLTDLSGNVTKSVNTGDQGDYVTGNQAGRIIKQTDATGRQEFRYGNMGEVIIITVQFNTELTQYRI